MKNKRTTAFVAVIILISAAVVLGALFGSGSSIDTPAVVLPTSAPGKDPAGDDAPDGPQLTVITPDTVQAAIATLSRAESYSRTVTIENFWEGGSGSQTLSVKQNGANMLIRQEDDGKNILFASNGSIFIWYDDAEDEIYTGSFMDYDADKWMRTLAYEDMLALPASDITEAGYAQFAGDSCIYAGYVSGALGYRNLLYVSVNTGLLMGAETWDGDTLTYRMSSDIPDLTAPDESLFIPPNASGEAQAVQNGQALK